MKRRIAALALGALVLTPNLAFAQTTDPQAALKEISAFLTKMIADARAAGKQIDLIAFQSGSIELAKKAVNGVDVEKIDPKQGLLWARLYGEAQMPKPACRAAELYLTTGPEAAQKFQAQSIMLDSCAEMGEAQRLTDILKSATPSTVAMGYSLASGMVSRYDEVILKKYGKAAVLTSLKEIETRLDSLTPANDQEKAQATAAKRLINVGRIRTNLMDAVSPAIVSERSYGEFKGMDSLKGKVVVLDFFAHWCGPCIVAFPEMKKLYEDLKGKGLEIVGVTTYYGYYKAENAEKQDMPRDTEFAKMGEFLKEYDLPWPVVYGERANFDAFGVTGIPHVTVIDRQGNVRKIKVGYYVGTFGAFRAFVEKLLTE